MPPPDRPIVSSAEVAKGKHPDRGGVEVQEQRSIQQQSVENALNVELIGIAEASGQTVCVLRLPDRSLVSLPEGASVRGTKLIVERIGKQRVELKDDGRCNIVLKTE